MQKRKTPLRKDPAPVKNRATPEKKVYYFEYNLVDGTLNELKDFKKPKHKPNWASISPDSNTVVFGRHFNLYWMDRANYEKALVMRMTARSSSMS